MSTPLDYNQGFHTGSILLRFSDASAAVTRRDTLDSAPSKEAKSVNFKKQIVYTHNTMHICIISCCVIQWDLFKKDALGLSNLSTVERLSTLQR